jgi:hypothetical protein
LLEIYVKSSSLDDVRFHNNISNRYVIRSSLHNGSLSFIANPNKMMKNDRKHMTWGQLILSAKKMNLSEKAHWRYYS